MVSCYYCVFHKCKGAAHTCEHCKNKVVYGEMQEKFLEPLYDGLTPDGDYYYGLLRE